MKRLQAPLWATLSLIPITVLLRVVSVVRYSAAVTDWFSLATAGLVVLFTVLLLLSASGKKQVFSLPEGKQVPTAALLLAVGGGFLLLYNVADLLIFTAQNAMFPVPYSIQSANRFLQILQLLCGILGGIFLLYTGTVWWRTKRCVTPIGNGLALLPVLWSWFRLARYVISYESAAGISDTIYDYGHLIFSLLFFMLLAHLLSGTRPVRQSHWIMMALPAAWFSLSGCISTVVLSLLPAQREVMAGNLASWVDLPFALLALFFAVNALQVTAVPADETPTAPTAEEVPVAAPTDEIAEEAVTIQEPAHEEVAEEPKAEGAESASENEAELLSRVLHRSEENKSLDALLQEFSSSDNT